jgi:hypothetical protein
MESNGIRKDSPRRRLGVDAMAVATEGRARQSFLLNGPGRFKIEYTKPNSGANYLSTDAGNASTEGRKPLAANLLTLFSFRALC